MAEYRRRDENIAWARRIVEWTNAHLQDADGRFFDSQKVATRQISRVKLTYNTALMLRALLVVLRESEGPVQAEAGSALAKMGKVALPALTAALKDAKPAVRLHPPRATVASPSARLPL